MKPERIISPAAQSLLEKLSEVAMRGPLPAVCKGAPAVGMTLLDALGVSYLSTGKPKYQGVAITARRGLAEEGANRVNLFARVPDWKISTCKSSAEIVSRFGYDGPSGDKRLFCTVRAARPNAQGLYLTIDPSTGLMHEDYQRGGRGERVASWQVPALIARLEAAHPESMWIRATSTIRDGREFLHYRKAVYTASPYIDRFSGLLADGAITVDHLIRTSGSVTVEKGPLFKIAPQNLSLLFPTSLVYDLMAL